MSGTPPTDRREIWIDLDNAPHVVTFAPIIRGLEARGWSVFLTARDVNDTPALARRYGLSPLVTGGAFPRRRSAKILGTLKQSWTLRRALAGRRPAMALSHGSRAQALAAWSAGIPLAVMFDYEGADLRVFRWLARWFYYPEALHPVVSTWGLPTERLRPFPGLKEHLALLTREDRPDLLAQAGVPLDRPYAVIRPESDTAHYLDRIDDTLLIAALDACVAWRLTPVLVPRSPSQRARLAELLAPRKEVVFPYSVVNGIDLLSRAQVLLSGGGTMNREAAVLGLPCISIFRGRLGIVDQSLIAAGQMHHVDSVEALAALQGPPRGAERAQVEGQAEAVLSWICEHLSSDALRGRRM